MTTHHRGPIGRFVDAIVGFLPDGGVDDEAPPPDVDGRRDADNAQKRAVLQAKSQMTLHGSGTTSYQTVEREPDRD